MVINLVQLVEITITFLGAVREAIVVADGEKLVDLVSVRDKHVEAAEILEEYLKRVEQVNKAER